MQRNPQKVPKQLELCFMKCQPKENEANAACIQNEKPTYAIADAPKLQTKSVKVKPKRDVM